MLILFINLIATSVVCLCLHGQNLYCNSPLICFVFPEYSRTVPTRLAYEISSGFEPNRFGSRIEEIRLISEIHEQLQMAQTPLFREVRTLKTNVIMHVIMHVMRLHCRKLCNHSDKTRAPVPPAALRVLAIWRPAAAPWRAAAQETMLGASLQSFGGTIRSFFSARASGGATLLGDAAQRSLQ